MQTVSGGAASLPPLQAAEDPRDGGGGLAPGVPLLPAPGATQLRFKYIIWSKAKSGHSI